MIIDDIKEMQKEFTEAQVLYEKRNHNYEAHNLAKAAVTLDFGRHLWLLSKPEFLYIPDFVS